jgi:hypothetical protein
MRAACCIDQLCVDAYPVSALSYRAFQHVADAELTADLLNIDRLALVREARIAGDNEQPADAGERGDDLLDHAVREMRNATGDVIAIRYADDTIVGFQHR